MNNGQDSPTVRIFFSCRQRISACGFPTGMACLQWEITSTSSESKEFHRQRMMCCQKTRGWGTGESCPIFEETSLYLRVDKVTEGYCTEVILSNAKHVIEEYLVAPPGNIPLPKKEERDSFLQHSNW
ncbi:glutamyl-tRNA(Gln) amidotransferase subunit C, mitochondrial [Scyliorhinus canicula]|uniref:glutamyl-tRNA(Gln) amidotransferase subunit C, mitochondrial n=1 Tax=Scyliorhinus canicula TaxID=7830 RepID=UPI0018F3D81B|nr:glutamyl-tRNA(Gln) amidotransferase subunit C, mitochondrial [Scyliorhinus canicula]